MTLPERSDAGAANRREPSRRRAARPRRVAVVGAGYVARFHLEALRELEGIEVVAICDPDRGRAEAAAAAWDVPRTVAAVEELIPLDLDVAHVLVPPDRHREVAGRLLEAGVGAFVEKPFVLDSREGRDLARLAAEHGVPLAVNHNNLWHPTFRRLRERLDAGEIGRLRHARLVLSTPLPQLDAGQHGHWMFRHPAHILFEQAVHPFSQLHALLGPVRRATTTRLGTRTLDTGAPFHDRWSIAVEAERGTAEVHLAFGASFERSTLEVLGTDGALDADLLHDLLSVERKTRWLPFWDGFLAGWRRGGALRRDALRGLVRYGASTLGLTRRSDVFFRGMRDSIRAFYQGAEEGEHGMDAAAATEVIAWCEAAAAGAARPTPVADPPPPRPAVGPRPGEVVVLGGTGFIGRRLVEALLDTGRPVTAVGRRPILPRELAAAAADGGLRVRQARLEEPDALREAVAGAHTVVHLATGSGETWEEVERAMVRGSVAVAEAALAAGVERFVYVSSIAALYTGPDAPVDEVRDDFAVDAQPEARDLYTRGKVAAELALGRLHRERGLPLVIVRPGVVLGEGTPLQHPGLGFWARDNHCIGWGLGEHPLPLVAVDDVADGLRRVVEHPDPDLHGRSLNLCGRPPLSARRVVEELAHATGRPLRFHPRPLPRSQAMEVGKWLVKRIGRRSDVPFPSYRDLKARSLALPFAADLARERLGWTPTDDPETFLDRTVRIHAPAGR